MAWTDKVLLGYGMNGEKFEQRKNTGMGNTTKEVQIFKDGNLVSNKKKSGGKMSDYTAWIDEAIKGANQGAGLETEEKWDVSKAEGAKETGWGAGNISKDDFVDPATGKARTLDDVYAKLDPKLPGKTGPALKSLIQDMAPKYTEDVYGMEKEKGFAKEAYEKDVYGLQKGARQAGGAMRSAYGGMGGGMRAGIGAAGDIGTQFAQAGQELGKSMYGIEKAGEEKYESDISRWLDPEWFKPQGKEGGYVKRDRSGITNNSEETFLDVLSQLPDAGGS